MCISVTCYLHLIIPLDAFIQIDMYISTHTCRYSLSTGHSVSDFVPFNYSQRVARMRLLKHGSDKVTFVLYILHCCCKRQRVYSGLQCPSLCA